MSYGDGTSARHLEAPFIKQTGSDTQRGACPVSEGRKRSGTKVMVKKLYREDTGSGLQDHTGEFASMRKTLRQRLESWVRRNHIALVHNW